VIKDKETRTLKVEPLEKRVAPFTIVSETDPTGSTSGADSTGPSTSDCPGQGGTSDGQDRGPVDVPQ
jgi:hypothetical protein